MAGPALDADDIEYTVQVHTYRRMLGARPRDRSTLHLGEAEGLCYIEKYQPNWVFISDDQSAIDFAVRRGLRVLRAMTHAGRGVRLPPDHWHVCPPP